MILASGVILLAASLPLQATLPDIPRGVSVLNTEPGDKGLRDGILGNPDVDMISISDDWNVIQPDELTYNWDYLVATINQIAPYNKSVLLRITTMGGSEMRGGNTPNWVFSAMGEDPSSDTADWGTTYCWVDGSFGTRCIPVFWQPVYLAKKKALIAMAGAHVTSDPVLNSAIKIVVISYANAITEDWNVPDDDSGDPSEVTLWLNTPTDVPPGAGYTTPNMIEAAIHQADAIFTDGSVQGTTLTSPSATFTQADLRHRVAGRGYGSNTYIVGWISPTQVTLNQPLSSGTGAKFKIIARRDGLIDVAVAAFPNQYICTSVSGNGPELDAQWSGDEDPGTYLAETVDSMAHTLYPTQYIVQRNNVTAIIPVSTDPDVDKTAWVLLNDAVTDGISVAGQALGTCYSKTGTDYRMNGGTNCDHDNSNCIPPCVDDCALSSLMILERSADRIASYRTNYYEVYPPDASNLKDGITYIHDLLNPISDRFLWFTNSLNLMTKAGPAIRVRHAPPPNCAQFQ